MCNMSSIDMPGSRGHPCGGGFLEVLTPEVSIQGQLGARSRRWGFVMT